MKWIITYLFAFIITAAQAQTVTWKEYTDQRFESMQQAVNKSEIAMEKRFESVNEFRNTLSDQQRTFVSRAEYDANVISLNTQLSEIKATLDKYENMKAGGSNILYLIIAIISSLVAFVALSRNFIQSIYKPRTP